MRYNNVDQLPRHLQDQARKKIEGADNPSLPSSNLEPAKRNALPGKRKPNKLDSLMTTPSADEILKTPAFASYPIIPIPKPRMTRSDKWKKRKCVMRYWGYKDMVRGLKIILPECGCYIIFYLPMPKSWSKKKKVENTGKAHKQTPDLDNLLKALFDALFENDSHIWSYKATKLWNYEGSIVIGTE